MKKYCSRILKSGTFAICAIVLTTSLSSCVERKDYAPGINENTIFNVGKNGLHFELNQEINTLDILSKAELTYQNDDGVDHTLTTSELSSRYCTYDTFDTSTIGNYTLNINYSTYDLSIDYSVDSYNIDFYLDETTPYLEEIKPIATLNNDLTLSCLVNPNIDYNYAIDPNTIANDEEKGLSFAGWTIDNNPVSGYYNIDPPVDGNVRNVRFMAKFLPEDEMELYDISYDDKGRKCFNGYNGAKLENLYIPESVTYIDLANAITTNNFTNLYIPSTAGLGTISSLIESDGLEAIYVDANNETVSSYDGILYNKNQTSLLFAPADIKSDFKFSPSITKIGDYAFAYSNLAEITNLPVSLSSIGDYAFAYSSLEKLETITANILLGHNIFYMSNITANLETDNIGQYYVNYDDNGEKLYTLIGIIDKTIREYTIWNRTVSIALNAFDECTDLEAITFNNDGMLESIGGAAFSGCISLKSAVIPDSVKYMGASAFYGCTGLVSATIPDVTSIDTGTYEHTLPRYTFYNCSSLTSVTLSDNIEVLDRYSISKCTSLTTFKLPKNLTTIGGYCFSNSTSFANLEFSEGQKISSLGVYAFNGCAFTEFDFNRLNISVIPSYSFYNCTKLLEIVLPENIIEIDDYGFSLNTGITKLELSPKLERIGQYAFYGSSKKNMLATLTLPNTLKEIDNRAFAYWQILTNVTIPDNVTYIGDFVFYRCYALTSIYIGARVATIGNYSYLEEDPLTFGAVSPTFYDCKELTTIEVSPSNLTYGVYNGVLYKNNFQEAIWSPAKNTFTNVTLHSNTKILYPYTFYSQTTVTNVTLNEGLENIGKAAFYGSTKIQSLTIPSSVTHIGAGICNKMTGLTNFTVSSNNPSYYSDGKFLYSTDGKSLKGYVTALSGSVTIPDGVEVIDYGALQSCTAITEIILPDSVKTIGERAFASDSKLESIVIGSGLCEIADDAFKDCKALNSIELNENNPNMKLMNSILYSTDEKIIYLSPTNNPMTELVISSKVEEIRGYAFAYNNQLTKIIFPENLKVINDYAFFECSNLAYLEFNDACTTIGEYSFSFLQTTFDTASTKPVNLKTVVLGKGITTVGKNAFQYNAMIEAVYYRATYTDVLKFKAANNSVPGIFYLFKGSDGHIAVQYTYSENNDFLVTPSNNYWHYVDGVITKW